MHFMTLYPDYIVFAGILIVLYIFLPSGTSQLTSKIDSLQKHITLMDSKLNKIANQVGVPKNPLDVKLESYKEELKSIIKKDGKIMAIKKVTLLTGLGLKEAKDYIDNLIEEKDFVDNLR